MKKTARRAPSKAASRRAGRENPDGLRVILSEKQIQKRVREIARQVNRDYQGEDVTVVGILEDGFMFMADLIRHLKVRAACCFLKADVRDGQLGAVPVREIMYTPKIEAAGKNILLVDAILQSGVTLDHLYRYMLGRNARSVRTATLIEKADERKVAVPTDYVGFKCRGKFLVGYGMGYQERYRNLPFVAAYGGSKKASAN